MLGLSLGLSLGLCLLALAWSFILCAYMRLALFVLKRFCRVCILRLASCGAAPTVEQSMICMPAFEARERAHSAGMEPMAHELHDTT